MDKQYTVYEITHLPSGRRYIGYTGLLLFTRFGAHYLASRLNYKDGDIIVKGNPSMELHRLMSTVPDEMFWSSFYVRPLYITKDREDAKKVEREFIKNYNTVYPNGLNSKHGRKPKSEA